MERTIEQMEAEMGRHMNRWDEARDPAKRKKIEKEMEELQEKITAAESANSG